MKKTFINYLSQLVRQLVFTPLSCSCVLLVESSYFVCKQIFSVVLLVGWSSLVRISLYDLLYFPVKFSLDDVLQHLVLTTLTVHMEQIQFSSSFARKPSTISTSFKLVASRASRRSEMHWLCVSFFIFQRLMTLFGCTEKSCQGALFSTRGATQGATLDKVCNTIVPSPALPFLMKTKKLILVAVQKTFARSHRPL